METKHTNTFDKRIETVIGKRLQSTSLKTIQANLGLRCNHSCMHCHLGASPRRTEQMQWATMEQIIESAKKLDAKLIDITGGAPELNPYFTRFIEHLSQKGHRVQVRTNLTVLQEPGMETVPSFFREHRVALVASLPCYTQENVDAQRGSGAYEKSIATLRLLNGLGYGKESDLELDLVYNPGGPVLPGNQLSLEEDYRRELSERFGIVFSHLFTITNMPIGRFFEELKKTKTEKEYTALLFDSFNPKTIDDLMCRHQISVGWDGTLYDCDFNLALDLPLNHGAPSHIEALLSRSTEEVSHRTIVTGNHCFGCTAGAGSSCAGALIDG
jgi:radical SAM/Cys-rich protein